MKGEGNGAGYYSSADYFRSLFLGRSGAKLKEKGKTKKGKQKIHRAKEQK